MLYSVTSLLTQLRVAEGKVTFYELAGISRHYLQHVSRMSWLLVFSQFMISDALATPPIPRPEGYGSVAGRIIFNGEIPKLRPQMAGADFDDNAICGRQFPNESLIVNAKNQGIKNVFVYLRRTPYTHPTMCKGEAKRVEQTIDGCRFSPRALIFNKEQTVILRSKKNTAHSISFFPAANLAFGSVEISKAPIVFDQFKNEEQVPFKIQCDIHPWMSSYWLILRTSYGTTTDENGRFNIAKLRTGEHRLTIWHERAGVIERRLKFDVQKDQTTDLGVIKLRIDRFKLRPEELE